MKRSSLLLILAIIVLLIGRSSPVTKDSRSITTKDAPRMNLMDSFSELCSSLLVELTSLYSAWTPIS